MIRCADAVLIDEAVILASGVVCASYVDGASSPSRHTACTPTVGMAQTERSICFEKSKWGLSFARIGTVMGLRGLRGGRRDATAREYCRDIGPAPGGCGKPDSVMTLRIAEA